MATASSPTMAASAIYEKNKSTKRRKRKKKQADVKEFCELEPDEWNSVFLIDEPAVGVLQDNDDMGCASQSLSTDSSAVPMPICVEAPVHVGEEEMETENVSLLRVTMGNNHFIYSKLVTSSEANSSASLTLSRITNIIAFFPFQDIILYPMGQ